MYGKRGASGGLSFAVDAPGGAHEEDFQSQLPRGLRGTSHDFPGSVVAPHGIDRDPQSGAIHASHSPAGTYSKTVSLCGM